MKNWLKILVALVIIGIIAAALVYKFYINKPHADIEKATPAYTIAAAELWKQYNTEIKAADSLYTGKVIEITGNISRTDLSDSLVFAVFVMEADSMFGNKSVRCEMLPKYNTEVKAFGKGAEVTIKGYCNGFDQTDIKFSKCSVVK
jgi:type II secretory pathway pseudopilin PulG